jgi:uncharacterized protein YbaP (TraB family)
VFSSNLIAQNGKPWPHTLLWKISGNGLAKNSFLYGTMHLQDKRLFYFSDSLYHYLEQADGYSMEIDLREMMDSVLQKLIDEGENYIFDSKRLERKEEKKKIIDSLMQNVKVFNDKQSKKQLKKFREERMEKAIKNKEMPTIMDAWLYTIARKKGKWVGGIEDVQDQISLLDELGADVTDEELMAPDAVLISSLEKMIEIYLANDLDKIEQYIVKQISDGMEDKVFTQRNIKMARRMDSLANIRSMFFAVGAAHLPGDSGVITLLRKRGYRVEPVLSTKKVDPIAYAANLPDLPWVKIEDERKTYSIDMPGEASDLNMFQNFVRMKFYLDITTLNVYMSGSVVSQRNLDFDKLLESISGNTGSRIFSKKKIEYKGMNGVETVMYSEGYYFKARYLLKDNILYMLMAGANKRPATDSKDVRKFLESFVANQVVTESNKQWSSFEVKEKAVSLMMPGKPVRNKKMESAAENTGWDFWIYNYTDEALGVYYMFQVRDIKAGYFVTIDTSFYALFRGSMSENIKKVTRDTVFNIGEFPAFAYEGVSEDDRLIFRTLFVNRGNRSYTLYAGGANDPKVDEQIRTFLNSLNFSTYEKAVWKKGELHGANFSTTVPAPIELKKSEGGEDADKVEYYISYNPIDCISYQVYKVTQSPYYWTSNDSSFFEVVSKGYIEWRDSVWSKKEVTNGKLKGMEYVIETPGSSNLKKLRQLLNGDTLYTLLSYIPAWAINDRDHNRFFEDFRAINEQTSSSLFKSKAEKLLTDLQSPDSATFAAASIAFNVVNFTKEDKKLLTQALLKNYPDDTSNLYYGKRDRIVTWLQDMMDSATVRYIKDNYSSLTGDREKIKFDVLDLLVRYKTAYSYSVLKELLIRDPPKEKDVIGLSYYITDSLKLTHTLFPEILQLTNDPVLVKRIIDITVEMLDSGMINMNMVMPYKKSILHTADTTLASLKEMSTDDHYGGQYTTLVQLLRYFIDDEANKIIQQYLLLDEMEIKYQSALALLKNRQTVDKKQIGLIAAEPEYRKSLYEALVEMGNKKLFPSKYLDQKYFAESDVYTVGSYDDSPEKIEYIGMRTLTYKGEKKHFYLFRVIYYTDEETGEVSDHLGIAGPYSLDPKNFETDNAMTNAYLEYDLKKLDEVVAEYLKELEEENKGYK